jgi:hypothetical protein
MQVNVPAGSEGEGIVMAPVFKSSSKPAASIDEVIDRLSAIILWASDNQSRMGYFAALYRKVTISVRNGIQNGLFDDAKRMERLDVIFANRYLNAFEAFRADQPIAFSWRLACQSAGDYWPIVLQHLLLGMNAHINLDLGIATAATMRGKNIEAIHGDFNKINGVLASLVKEVSDELAEVWMTLRVLNRFLRNEEDAIINFSMRKARDEAWESAQRFAALADERWADAIAVQDRIALVIGGLVRRPNLFRDGVIRAIRLGEVSSVRKVIEILT